MPQEKEEKIIEKIIKEKIKKEIKRTKAEEEILREIREFDFKKEETIKIPEPAMMRRMAGLEFLIAVIKSWQKKLLCPKKNQRERSGGIIKKRI